MLVVLLFTAITIFGLKIAGDMGIGNTTPAAALIAVLTASAPAEVTGRGTGVDDATLARKASAIASAVARADGTQGVDLLARIAAALAPLVPTDTEELAGLEMGGIPIVTALSMHTGIPAAFVRKEAKKYGTARLAEGADIEGRRVTVVEDVITTGGQVVISTNQLRELGAKVDHVLCVIDRSPDHGAALAAEGLAMHALLTRAQLDEAAARRGS